MSIEKAKPILFNTEMVRAIFNGRKTVTRRVVKKTPNRDDLRLYERNGEIMGLISSNARVYDMPVPCQPGDVLYVRETWAKGFIETSDNGDAWFEEATDHDGDAIKSLHHYFYREEWEGIDLYIRWHPSIHMPKEAARIFLRVTNVRVERLQDITLQDCINEGVWKGTQQHENIINRFIRIWNSTIKVADLARYGWDANPWVWVIEFERISKEEAYKNV